MVPRLLFWDSPRGLPRLSEGWRRGWHPWPTTLFFFFFLFSTEKLLSEMSKHVFPHSECGKTTDIPKRRVCPNDRKGMSARVGVVAYVCAC